MNMTLFQLVIKDVLSRKKRVVYAAFGVVIGTMTVIAILTASLAGKEQLYNQLEKYGPNLTIVPAVNQLDISLGNLSLGAVSVGDNYISEDTIPFIRQIADSRIREELDLNDQGEIATIAPRLYVDTSLNQFPIVVVGIVPFSEYLIKSWWRMREGVFLETDDQTIIGAAAAELLGVKTGDHVDMDGTDMIVAGVLDEVGTSDDYQMFVDLQTVQRTFHKENLVSTIDVRALCNACPVAQIADGINDSIAGVRAVAVKQVAANEMEMMGRINNLMLMLAGIASAIGMFGVANTMAASVQERTKDIGIMRAVGASRNQILLQLLVESAIVGILGGFAGFIAGSALAFGIGPLIFGDASVHVVLGYLPLSIGLATAVSMLAGIYPAFRATRIRVADSFRA